jgi:hypothetical protein
MAVGNTLVANNQLTTTTTVSNAAVLAAIASPQVIPGTESCSFESGGTSDSQGGNIEDRASCNFTEATDQQNTAVELGALADNGGPTLTHMISDEGAAFNRGVDALCLAPPVNGVDQRGVTRPQLGPCDVGAVEVDVPSIRSTYFPEIYLRFSF